MARTIDFLPEAADELEDALRWYQDVESELATQFAFAVGDAMEQIAQFPGAGQPVFDAVTHLSRLPGYCRDRA